MTFREIPCIVSPATRKRRQIVASVPLPSSPDRRPSPLFARDPRSPARDNRRSAADVPPTEIPWSINRRWVRDELAGPVET